MFHHYFRFGSLEEVAEVFENQPVGTFVAAVPARSKSTVYYSITEGNDVGMFTVSPSSGVLSLATVPDYEEQTFYNLTITASNMANQQVIFKVIVNNSPTVRSYCQRHPNTVNTDYSFQFLSVNYIGKSWPVFLQSKEFKK